MLPPLVVAVIGLLFVVDARPSPRPSAVERLEADVRLDLASACTRVTSGSQTLLVSPGEVVVEDAEEVVVNLPLLANDVPDGALVGVGIALDGVVNGVVGEPFDPQTMALGLGETVVVGPGRWPIVVAYKPQGVGQLTLLGSMTMRAAAGYRPPEFTLTLSEDCPDS